MNINSEQLKRPCPVFKNQNEDGEKLVRKCQHSKFAQTITTLTNVYIYFRFILMQNFTRRVE